MTNLTAFDPHLTDPDQSTPSPLNPLSLNLSRNLTA